MFLVGYGLPVESPTCSARVSAWRAGAASAASAVLLLLTCLLGDAHAQAQAPPRTLVLPPRTVGVELETARVFSSLLSGELESHHVPLVPSSALPSDLVAGEQACDESACAVQLARGLGAERVVFCTLSRLGDKIIVRVRSQAADAAEPDYNDQVPAEHEGDLDVVARRIGETLAGGQPNAGRATIGSITEKETQEPRRRASRTGVGFRGSVLLPAGDSYGGADQLAGFRLTTRYETPTGVFVETSPLFGFMWGSGNVEWTVLDVGAGRVFGQSDFAPYMIGGLGLHVVHIERQHTVTTPYGSYQQPYGQNATTMAGEFGVGWMMLRTYDFSLVMDLRYHVVFGSFDQVDGNGAHGVMLSFGTTR